jgi:outer membrane biosynthesis protein TonB
MGMFGAAGAVLLGSEPRRDCAAAVVEGADVTQPRPTERPRPEYPEALRAAGVHGLVTVEAVVGVDGTPRSPRLLTPGAPPTLILAATESLRRSRFIPAQRAGIAVPYCYSSSMRFELVDRPQR